MKNDLDSTVVVEASWYIILGAAAALETLGPPLFNVYLLQTVQRCTRGQNNFGKCSVSSVPIITLRQKISNSSSHCEILLSI